MPFGDEGVDKDAVGLALSGGGFRATLFHVGVLWRLNELGWLPRLDRVSSVSGGSITAGILATAWGTLDFQNGGARNFRSAVVDRALSFTKRRIDSPSIWKGLLTPGRSVGEVVAGQYREHLFGQRGLQSLPDRPRFVFNATNLGTGSSWRFQKPYSGDYKIGLLRNHDFPIATCVAASAAFPPVLSPVVLDLNPGPFERTPGAYLYDSEDLRSQVSLADGGVYDNMGLECVWKRCGGLLVSDAGGSPSMQFGPKRLWHNQLDRAYALTIEQDRDLRRRILHQDFKSQDRRGAYWLISWPIKKFTVAGGLTVSQGWDVRLGSIRTRLDPFTDEEQRCLINWGYALSDAAVRRWVEPSPVPPAWPFPEWSLDRSAS